MGPHPCLPVGRPNPSPEGGGEHCFSHERQCALLLLGEGMGMGAVENENIEEKNLFFTRIKRILLLAPIGIFLYSLSND